MPALPEHATARVAAHKFKRQRDDHYVDPPWVSERLFATVDFPGVIWDPACGWGRIPIEVQRILGAGSYTATDLIFRGYGEGGVDFLKTKKMRAGSRSIVCNPPFDLLREFAEHALDLGAEKIAMITQMRRLPAAHWLKQTPLSQVLLLTPRPSMPTGRHIRNGGKVRGGIQEFCWLVWDQTDPKEQAEISWLHRDGAKQ